MRLIHIVFSAWVLTGCSVLMALEGDPPPDYSLLTPGTPRSHVLARHGVPLLSETKDGRTYDTYEFEEGDEAAPQRVGIHLVADIATFGAWELIGTPYEWFQGEDVAYVLEYGPDDVVQSVVPPPPGRSLHRSRRPAAYPTSAALTSPRRPLITRPTSEVDQVPILISGQSKPKSHAVIIGVETYRENLPKADYAAHDAKIMAKYLIHTLGFPEENVVVLLNNRATRADFHKYLEGWLPNRVEPNDSVFIYFSGHGAPNVKSGEAYMVPYDGDPLYIDKTGYPLQLLYDHMNRLSAKEVLVVLDSCFSGAGGRSVIAKGMRPLVLSVENPILTEGKTIVLGASAAEQVSNTYQKKNHGLLTYFLPQRSSREG